MKIYNLCILMTLVVAGHTSPLLTSIDIEEITMAEVTITLCVFSVGHKKCIIFNLQINNFLFFRII